MSTALEVTGFIMCVASWMVTGVSLANDYWKISSISGSVIISTRQYENLWHSCAEDSSGIAECRDFQSMLALPGRGELHETRLSMYKQEISISLKVNNLYLAHLKVSQKSNGDNKLLDLFF